MGRNKVSFYSFLAIFLFLVFTSYNVNSFQDYYIPKSERERQLAELLHIQIQVNALDDFIKNLDKYPQYVNIVYYYEKYRDFLTPLQIAAILGRDRFIDELLKRDADPSLPTLSKRNTILHLSPLPRITRRFINLGLDLEALNDQEMTPLLSQVFKLELNREVILTLLKAKANVRAETDTTKLTALHILLRPHHLYSDQEVLLIVLRDILNHGGRVLARDKKGATPLHFAAARNNVQAIQMFIDKAKQLGKNNFVNVRDFEFEDTPLFVAYVSQAREAITQLLKLGANPLSRNKSGVSVNGLAHRGSRSDPSFSSFVLGEIEKYFKPSNRCIKPLIRGREALQYEL